MKDLGNRMKDMQGMQAILFLPLFGFLQLECGRLVVVLRGFLSHLVSAWACTEDLQQQNLWPSFSCSLDEVGVECGKSFASSNNSWRLTCRSPLP